MWVPTQPSVPQTVGKKAPFCSKKRGAGWRLLFCLFFSLGVHFLFLLFEPGMPGIRSFPDTARASSFIKVLQARLRPDGITLTTQQEKSQAPSLAIPFPTTEPTTSSEPATDISGGPLTTGAGILALPPAHYPASLLTERPSFKEEPDEDAAGAPDKEHAGKLTASFYLDAAGRIESIAIDTSTLTSSQEAWLMQKLQKMLVRPGRLLGKAVPTRWVLEFTLGPTTPPAADGSSSPIR
ncbi:MAG: hypothetical protein JWL63_240 [Rhodocyclales bacterium]|nr:hypothetical protein [Rhodocyclales bacterium]